ncbi:Floral homeotic protein APETALA 1 A [Bienertia sinuspersici]
MEKILERYERYSYAERRLSSNDPDSQVNWTFDFAKLKAKLELLQKNHRYANKHFPLCIYSSMIYRILNYSLRFILFFTFPFLVFPFNLYICFISPFVL